DVVEFLFIIDNELLAAGGALQWRADEFRRDFDGLPARGAQMRKWMSKFLGHLPSGVAARYVSLHYDQEISGYFAAAISGSRHRGGGGIVGNRAGAEREDS